MKFRKEIAAVFLPPIFLLSGCVTANKHVLVSVIDEETGTPVVGATVRTIYVSSSKFSLASKRTFEAITDSSGRAMMIGNFLLPEPAIGRTFPKQGFRPGFEVQIDNSEYEANMFTFGLDYYPPPFDRPGDFLPNEPDLTFRIPSRATQAVRRAEFQEKMRQDNQQAREWLENNPEFWPISDEARSTQPRPRAEYELIRLRWEKGSTLAMGSDEDDLEINRLVLAGMNHPNGRTNEKRWLSPTLVMVDGSWYSGPLSAAGYKFVLEKKKGRWEIIAYYVEWMA